MGCPKNEVDSDRIASYLTAEGFIEARSREEADILMVNTCSFIESAAEESIGAILDIAAEKGPGTKLFVTGCLPQRYGAELGELLPEVDGFFTPEGSRDNGIDFLEPVREKRLQADGRRARYSGSERGFTYIKIAEGCDRRCTFCTIPRIKGKFRSERMERIAEEAKGALDLGVKELVLVAQDTASYGADLGLKDGLVRLLEELLEIPGDFRIRLLYLQPDGVTPRLLETLNHPKMCPYLDLPLQHICQEVLRIMGRGGGEREFGELLEEVRERVPGVALRTSVMVGFPGEDRIAFNKLLRFVGDAEFDWLSVFVYSPEEGTKAAGLRERCSQTAAERRAERVKELQEEIMREKASRMKGKELRVLVEGPSAFAPGFLEARSYREAPDIDGAIFIESSGGFREPCFCSVKIEDSDGIDLIGSVIGERHD